MAEQRCLACMNPITAGAARCPYCGSAVPCPPNPRDALQPGYVLNSRFVIGKAIGRGGYGITYIVFDRRLLTVRCIKEFFPKGYRRKPDMSPYVPQERKAEFDQHARHFLQEARIQSIMTERNVENVALVLDQLNLNGTTYILMEYLKGCTMDEWLKQRKQGLEWEEARDVLVEVLKALQQIHLLGFLHRDLSLSNIFRKRDGQIRLIDFGSAEFRETALNHPERLWPSRKAWYSPPEQINRGVQTPESDTYAAGVCLFKMIAGGWPTDRNPGSPLPSLKRMGFKVPQALDALIARATDPDPAKRFPTAQDMREELESIQETILDPEPPPGFTDQPGDERKDQGKQKEWWEEPRKQQEEPKPKQQQERKGWLGIAAGAAAVGIMAAALLIWHPWDRGSEERRDNDPPTPTTITASTGTSVHEEQTDFPVAEEAKSQETEEKAEAPEPVEETEVLAKAEETEAVDTEATESDATGTETVESAASGTGAEETATAESETAESEEPLSTEASASVPESENTMGLTTAIPIGGERSSPEEVVQVSEKPDLYSFTTQTKLARRELFGSYVFVNSDEDQIEALKLKSGDEIRNTWYEVWFKLEDYSPLKPTTISKQDTDGNYLMRIGDSLCGRILRNAEYYRIELGKTGEQTSGKFMETKIQIYLMAWETVGDLPVGSYLTMDVNDWYDLHTKMGTRYEVRASLVAGNNGYAIQLDNAEGTYYPLELTERP